MADASLDELVYLNISGYKFITDRRTLCPPDQPPNYFSTLLDEKFQIRRDRDDYIFINRPGIYFQPILEFLQTGQVVVPEGINKKALVREAAFYCIDFPLGEQHESLSFVTDEWLSDRVEDRAYHRISYLADRILQMVLQQFKDKADKGLRIESDPFLVEDQRLINDWLDQSQHAKDYSRFDFIDRQKKLYSQPCVVHDEYFWLLADEGNRRTIIDYCKRHDLTVEIVPVTLHEPGLEPKDSDGSGGRGRVSDTNYLTLGYKFVHLTKTFANYEMMGMSSSSPTLSRNDRASSTSSFLPHPKRRSLPQLNGPITKQ